MKEKALEYIDQYIDYLKEIKDGASKNSQKIAKLQAMYHGIAHDRLSNYQSFFDNYKQPFSAQEKALKYIDRYIDYLKKLKNDALKNSEKITELQRMSHEIANYTLTNYQSLFDDYEQTFSEQDWTAAVRYFTDPAHVDTVYAGNRNNGLMYSYVKTADEVLHRRQEERGCGFFGRVRSSQQRTPSTPSVIKRQKFPVTNFGEPLTWRRTIAAFHKDLALRYEKLEAFSEKEALRRDYERISALYNLYDDVGVDRSAEIIAEYLWLPMVKREAEISLDVGVALSPLVIKRDADGFVCSVYQEMKDFGAPLLWTLEKLPPEEDSQRLDYAIQLLLQVSELHAGRRVVSGKKICHRDVKLDNLLCDGEHVQLVDFGFAKDTCDLDQAHRCN
ncbi:MAG: phosphotransferase [Legionellaceae bacterium]|nr:phosphotransferase [Legionellaceae bacterium]